VNLDGAGFQLQSQAMDSPAIANWLTAFARRWICPQSPSGARRASKTFS